MFEGQSYFYGTGRRKSSVARVRVYNGTGKITINDRDIDDYFGLETLKLIVRQPLNLTGTADKFDIVCRVAGGGVTGQAGAIRHGISRALLQFDGELRPELKKAGLLTRDPRMKERKKYGLKGARRTTPSTSRISPKFHTACSHCRTCSSGAWARSKPPAINATAKHINRRRLASMVLKLCKIKQFVKIYHKCTLIFLINQLRGQIFAIYNIGVLI